MKLETPWPVIAAVAIALGIGALGCNTRTAIGDVFDAGGGSDAAVDVLGHGTGDTTGSGGLTGTAGTMGTTGGGGTLGTTGMGGATFTGEGGTQAQGGRTGAGGRKAAAGGAPGAGAGGVSGENGGAGGTNDATACRSYVPPAPDGAGGHLGPQCWVLLYPASGFYGENILADGCTAFTSGVDYELGAAQTAGLTVQVTITSLSITGIRTGIGGGDGSAVVTYPGWSYDSGGDWRAKDFDPATQQQLFQTRMTDDNETLISFMGTGTARVDIYDCDPTTPSRSKVISWAPPHP